MSTLNFVKKYFGKKLNFFLRFWHFWWQQWIRNKISCQRYMFFSFYLHYIKSNSVFCQKNFQSWTYYLWLQLTESRYLNKLKTIWLASQWYNNFFWKKMTHWKCFRFLATLVLCSTQPGNYAVKMIQMALDIWNTIISVKICANLL